MHRCSPSNILPRKQYNVIADESKWQTMGHSVERGHHFCKCGTKQTSGSSIQSLLCLKFADIRAHNKTLSAFYLTSFIPRCAEILVCSVVAFGGFVMKSRYIKPRLASDGYRLAEAVSYIKSFEAVVQNLQRGGLKNVERSSTFRRQKIA